MPAHTDHPSPSELHRIRRLRVPAMVIVLIFRLDRPFRAKEVATLLGIDYQATRGYLQDLAHPEVGLLTRTRQGWVLAAGGRQLILAGGDIAPQSIQSAQRKINQPVKAAENAGKARFLNGSIITTTAESKDSEIKDSAAVVRRKSADKARSTPIKPKKSAENPRFLENLQAMDAEGIKENATTRLIAAMEHVTPDYIRCHARCARQNDEKLGLAIHRIRQADPLPGNANGHPDGCRCHACWVDKVRSRPEWYQT